MLARLVWNGEYRASNSIFAWPSYWNVAMRSCQTWRDLALSNRRVHGMTFKDCFAQNGRPGQAEPSPRRYDVLPVRGPAPIVHRTKCKSMQFVRTASPPGEYAASTQGSTGWHATGPKSTCESLDLGSYPTPWGFDMRLIKSLPASDDIGRSTWPGIATMRSGT